MEDVPSRDADDYDNQKTIYFHSQILLGHKGYKLVL